MAEEANGAVEPELLHERPQRRLERAAARQLKLEVRHLLPCGSHRAQQHDVSLDRDQPPDAEEPRRRGDVRGRGAVDRDSIVDDLEAPLREALCLGEVARQAAGDRDVDVREARDGAVGEGELASLAELVEAVLRREPEGYAGQRAGQLAVHVGVHEVRV